MPSRLHKTESTSGPPTDRVSTNTPCQWRNYSDPPGLPCLLHTGSSWEWQKLQFKPVWDQDPEAQSSSLDHCCSGQRAFVKQVTSSRSFCHLHSHCLIMGSRLTFNKHGRQVLVCAEKENDLECLLANPPTPVTIILLNFTEQPGLCGKHVT